jgi:hypothetical protein
MSKIESDKEAEKVVRRSAQQGMRKKEAIKESQLKE